MDHGRGLGLRLRLAGGIDFESEGVGGAGGGNAQVGTIISITGSATAAASATAALEAGAAIPFAESGGEAVGLAGGLRTSFGFGRFFRFAFGTILFTLRGFDIGGVFGTLFRLDRVYAFGDHLFGGDLSGVGFVVVILGFSQEDLTGLFDGVNVFEFSLIDVVGQFGERGVDVCCGRLRFNDRGRLRNGNGFDGERHFRGRRRFDGFDWRGQRRGDGGAAVLGKRLAGENHGGLGRLRAEELGDAGGDVGRGWRRGRSNSVLRGIRFEGGDGGIGRAFSGCVFRIGEGGTGATAAAVSATTAAISTASAITAAAAAVPVPEGANFIRGRRAGRSRAIFGGGEFDRLR